MNDKIIDEIDELISQALTEGEAGADRKRRQAATENRCPHCGEDWHGLAITEQMQTFRSRGRMSAGYRYNNDDSPIVCPGSAQLGPVRRQLFPSMPFLISSESNLLGTDARSEDHQRALTHGVSRHIGVKASGPDASWFINRRVSDRIKVGDRVQIRGHGGEIAYAYVVEVTSEFRRSTMTTARELHVKTLDPPSRFDIDYVHPVPHIGSREERAQEIAAQIMEAAISFPVLSNDMLRRLAPGLFE